MSREKNRQEAARWFKTAADDLDTAKILRERSKFAHACFHAQQAGEKALKAIWYSLDADPWGHSIKKLMDDLESIDLVVFEKLKEINRLGLFLDRFYIPTRYPNGLPDLTPDVAFQDEDAEVCIQYAEEIVNRIDEILGS
ncbi:MAG: HEPN domain-containing protein [Deltaproteobacteria bacterium]|nr:HEPN domain-containing protein [Deltaproteobacteria bacterium]